MEKMLNILIVEDEFISRLMLKELLSQFGTCKIATNGREAVDVLHESYRDPEGKFDLVCLDIMMPEMDGHEVLKEIRNIERRNGLKGEEITKVMMVTALDDARNIMEAFVFGGCQAYLTKPVSKGRLEEQLFHMRLIDKLPSA